MTRIHRRTVAHVAGQPAASCRAAAAGGKQTQSQQQASSSKTGGSAKHTRQARWASTQRLTLDRHVELRPSVCTLPGLLCWVGASGLQCCSRQGKSPAGATGTSGCRRAVGSFTRCSRKENSILGAARGALPFLVTSVQVVLSAALNAHAANRAEISSCQS